MRRAFIAANVRLDESFSIAADWAAHALTVIAPSTSAVEAERWLENAGVPIGVSSRKHSRFTARPQGTVIAWCLSLKDLLELECKRGVEEVVLVRGHDEHAPWITAHGVECLAGSPVAAVPEASAAIKTMVEGVTTLAVQNQGLVDQRERAGVAEALTYFRQRGHTFDPAQLVVEAIRQGWPGSDALEIAELATSVNAGKQLRFEQRFRPEVIAEWEQATAFEYETR
ncbi:hypothetical protein [Sporichthya polymorpha]|uniref:hypothetical protein n=1 Tax=Sporichthya polymorpha TaxID=35751 RepID=UPI000376969B|nr:hypothetical protein [Sporichthya polymorpha]